MMSNEDFVNVPVPASRVMEVYALLSRPVGETFPGAHEDQSPVGPAGGGEEWTVADFGRLLRDHRESSHRVSLVLDALAKRPDKAVSLSELSDDTGMTRMQIRGALSGFTRTCKALWPDNQGDRGWPMRPSWGATEQDGQDGEAHYTFPSNYAGRWKQARQS